VLAFRVGNYTVDVVQYLFLSQTFPRAKIKNQNLLMLLCY